MFSVHYLLVIDYLYFTQIIPDNSLYACIIWVTGVSWCVLYGDPGAICVTHPSRMASTRHGVSGWIKFNLDSLC